MGTSTLGASDMTEFKSSLETIFYYRHAFAFQISLVQSLQYFEHLAEPMAEILDLLDKEFDIGSAGDEVLR